MNNNTTGGGKEPEDKTFMEIQLMAKAMKYTEWKRWVQQNHPKMYELYFEVRKP